MYSIIMPMDLDRLEQFANTKRAYDAMKQQKEFVIPTRNRTKLERYLVEHGLFKGVKLVPYTVEKGFNCSRALNHGVRAAISNRIIITSPEVIPMTDVLTQFDALRSKNVVAQVFDQNEDGTTGISLVNKYFRGDSPAMYFLALFNKRDILKINGWDEDFMKGYAYEDNDFGERWKRAGLPFEMHEEIQALHQYHPRKETIEDGTAINHLKFVENNNNGVTRCQNGLI